VRRLPFRLEQVEKPALRVRLAHSWKLARGQQVLGDQHLTFRALRFPNLAQDLADVLVVIDQ